MDGWIVERTDDPSHGNNAAIWKNKKQFFWKWKEINDPSLAQL